MHHFTIGTQSFGFSYKTISLRQWKTNFSLSIHKLNINCAHHPLRSPAALLGALFFPACESVGQWKSLDHFVNSFRRLRLYMKTNECFAAVVAVGGSKLPEKDKYKYADSEKFQLPGFSRGKASRWEN